MPHRFERPPLINEKILKWAEHQYRVTGSWPNCNSGAVVDVPGETWAAINAALSKGQRGIPGGSSLAKLLAKRWHIGRWARPADLLVQEAKKDRSPGEFHGFLHKSLASVEMAVTLKFPQCTSATSGQLAKDAYRPTNGVVRRLPAPRRRRCGARNTRQV